jgi:DNA modification methylase
VAHLEWGGKRPPGERPRRPARRLERHGAGAATAPWRDRVYRGDNLDVIEHLRADPSVNEKVRLLYIDPPFGSGADYRQYGDRWQGDAYLQFMYERLAAMRELLAPDGSLVVHCDTHRAHHLRCLLDEVFGAGRFVNEVVWYYPNKIQGNIRALANNHDVLLRYRAGSRHVFQRIEEERDRAIRINARYWDAARNAFATRRDASGKILYIERAHRLIDDVWIVPAVSSSESKRAGFETQKPEDLLERVVLSCSQPGDLVADLFLGSGTTGLVARRLGRRFVGCDVSTVAVRLAVARLTTQSSPLDVWELRTVPKPSRLSDVPAPTTAARSARAGAGEPGGGRCAAAAPRRAPNRPGRRARPGPRGAAQ